jgi:hypothetical protein
VPALGRAKSVALPTGLLIRWHVRDASTPSLSDSGVPISLIDRVPHTLHAGLLRAAYSPTPRVLVRERTGGAVLRCAAGRMATAVVLAHCPTLPAMRQNAESCVPPAGQLTDSSGTLRIWENFSGRLRGVLRGRRQAKSQTVVDWFP